MLYSREDCLASRTPRHRIGSGAAALNSSYRTYCHALDGVFGGWLASALARSFSTALSCSDEQIFRGRRGHKGIANGENKNPP